MRRDVLRERKKEKKKGCLTPNLSGEFSHARIPNLDLFVYRNDGLFFFPRGRYYFRFGSRKMYAEK